MNTAIDNALIFVLAMLPAIIKGRVSLDVSVDVLKFAVQFKAALKEVLHFRQFHSAKYAAVVRHALRIKLVSTIKTAPPNCIKTPKAYDLDALPAGVLSTECGLKWYVDRLGRSPFLSDVLRDSGFFKAELPKEWFLDIPYETRIDCMSEYYERQCNLHRSIDPAWIAENIPHEWHSYALMDFADPAKVSLDIVASMVDRDEFFQVVKHVKVSLFTTDVRDCVWYARHLYNADELYQVLIYNGTILPEAAGPHMETFVECVWDAMQKYV